MSLLRSVTVLPDTLYTEKGRVECIIPMQFHVAGFWGPSSWVTHDV